MELTINTSTKSITIHNSVSLKELNDFLSSKFTEKELSEYSVCAEAKEVAPFRITDPVQPFGDSIRYTDLEVNVFEERTYSWPSLDLDYRKAWTTKIIGHEPFTTERVVTGVYKPFESSTN